MTNPGGQDKVGIKCNQIIVPETTTSTRTLASKKPSYDTTELNSKMPALLLPIKYIYVTKIVKIYTRGKTYCISKNTT